MHITEKYRRAAEGAALCGEVVKILMRRFLENDANPLMCAELPPEHARVSEAAFLSVLADILEHKHKADLAVESYELVHADQVPAPRPPARDARPRDRAPRKRRSRSRGTD